MCARACVYVALDIQHAMRPVWLNYFSTLPHKPLDFRKKKVILKKNVFCFSLQLLSEKVLIVRRIQRDISINVTGTTCKVPVIILKL